MGGMNLVVHAIVVVTIGVVTSRTVVVIPVVPCCHLLLIAKIKMNCKLAFKSITLLQLKTCFMLKSKSRASST